ncbi:zf-CCHC domain-containing protein [Tanacetum coccineum]
MDDKKNKSDRKCFICGDLNHLIGECPKPPRNKEQKDFVGGSWSDSENEAKDKTNEETCLMAQSSPSSKVGLRFDKNKVSTSGTKQVNFVGSTTILAGDRSTIKANGYTMPESFNLLTSQNMAEHVLSPPMSSRSDFVIVRKKLIHKNVENSKRPPHKPSLKNGLGFVKTESRSKTPPPRRNNSSQPRYNTPQPRRNSSGLIYENHYPVNWNNNQTQGYMHMGNCIPFQYPNQMQ